MEMPLKLKTKTKTTKKRQKNPQNMTTRQLGLQAALNGFSWSSVIFTKAIKDKFLIY